MSEVVNPDTSVIYTGQASSGISVIMPVFNGVAFITSSLPPLIAMQQRGEILEVIVIDDGSTDESKDLAAQMGAKVLSSGGRMGPGGARNQAAAVARGDILWFVDADVVVRADAARCLSLGFSGPDIAAVFGSYDSSPPARNFFSQYKNLVHHYYHQHAKEEAHTFWSGCGAVRRTAFLDSGGFDVERYKFPSI
jgi:glycosyltransferase involved in cell wall biosynthesis